ncbi:MAG TPA: diaminopimelate decarboxylase [Gammaproteobacteria bacterium]|nr:diaminopimelate decarboxylase [Gammaproteobacteria bacterium]
MTDPFTYRDRQLYAEGVPLAGIARQHGTPVYVYSRAAIEARWREFDAAFSGHPHLICYAVKANANLAVLNVLARLGSGFDIVSVGELERVLRAGGRPECIVFAGVGKRGEEMERALTVGIRCFNVESEAELERLNEIAGRLDKKAPVSLRINPDVDARTHPYISTGLQENKFGIAMTGAARIYARAAAMPHIEVIGIGCHIGSQLTDSRPFADALERLFKLLGELAHRGIELRHIDIGGGLGIRYRDETPPSVADYAAAIRRHTDRFPHEILLEPGRAIVGNAGVLVTRVEYLKPAGSKNFVIVDAAMNDLTRPALYDAWHDIVPVSPREQGVVRSYDVVGPVCESGDFLGRGRSLKLESGDLLAVRSAGAYGFSMSSTYNARPRAAEVMVEGETAHLIRRRESLDDLMIGESILTR